MPKFAQHFLINQHAAERIVESLNLAPTDHVLEIGAGKGALTALLVSKAQHVTAVEIDPELAAQLNQKFQKSGKLTVIEQDVLKFDFRSLVPADTTASNAFKVVGNLPYNLTSPILRKLCDWTGWTEAVVMVQKEVGDRLCAKFGTASYGALTVGVSLTCAIQSVFDLSETSFKPPPHVRSSVVKLVRLEKPLTDDVPFAQRVIQAAFQQRRKTLLNSLSHGLGLEKEDIRYVLEKVGIPTGERPEKIAPQRFVNLADELEILIERESQVP